MIKWDEQQILQRSCVLACSYQMCILMHVTSCRSYACKDLEDSQRTLKQWVSQNRLSPVDDIDGAYLPRNLPCHALGLFTQKLSLSSPPALYALPSLELPLLSTPPDIWTPPAIASACSYGIAYWHQRFPHWPLRIKKCECPSAGQQYRCWPNL
jgi:hypothetical protein